MTPQVHAHAGRIQHLGRYSSPRGRVAETVKVNVRHRHMKANDSRSIVFRTEEKNIAESVVNHLREGGVICQVQDMSVWQYGLPSTEFEMAVAQSDEHKACDLIAGLPRAVPCSGLTPTQRTWTIFGWTIFGLAVIALVAIMRLIRLVISD